MTDENVTYTEELKFKKDTILFSYGEETNDLYFIKSGKVLVYVQNGSKITPIAYIGNREFIGELNLFDRKTRSATIITLEDTEVVKIDSTQLLNNMPDWLKTIGSILSKKIRLNDEIIKTKGLRKVNVDTIKPLTIEEQTRIYKISENYRKEVSDN